MSRLTEKLKSGNYICGIIKGGFVDKLGKIEDLEEQLGCPLEKISTTNEIYSDLDGKMKKFEIIGINFCEKKIYFWMDFAPMYLEFDEYKKSWWLREDRSE